MTPERKARLIALGALHDEWVATVLPASPFNPVGRKTGSDYNLHYVDLEADDDEFHRRAADIFRP